MIVSSILQGTDTTAVLARTLIIYLVLTLLFLAFTEMQFRPLSLLHSRGFVRRHQEPMSTARNITQALIGFSSVTGPMALYTAVRFHHWKAQSIVAFDLKEILAFQVVMLVAVDAWHRYLVVFLKAIGSCTETSFFGETFMRTTTKCEI